MRQGKNGKRDELRDGGSEPYAQDFRVYPEGYGKSLESRRHGSNILRFMF